MNIDLEIAAKIAAEEHVVKDLINSINETPTDYLRVTMLAWYIIRATTKRAGLVELQDILKSTKYAEADVNAVYNTALAVAKADICSSAHK